jgi:hypothetical protein
MFVNLRHHFGNHADKTDITSFGVVTQLLPGTSWQVTRKYNAKIAPADKIAWLIGSLVIKMQMKRIPNGTLFSLSLSFIQKVSSEF